MGLIPEHITTQTELNEWEQANILEAEMWFSASHRFAYNNVPTAGNVTGGQNATPNITALLDVTFLQQIHKRMFDKTWRWAGHFRKSNKNIGVDWRFVPTYLRQLLEDIKYQITKGLSQKRGTFIGSYHQPHTLIVIISKPVLRLAINFLPEYF